MFDKYLKAKGILFTNNLDLWKVNRAAALQGMMKASHLKKVPIDHQPFKKKKRNENWKKGKKKVVAWAVESTQNLIDVWKEKVTLDDLAIKNVDIDVYLTKLTLDVIGKAAFSIDINSIRDDDSVMNKKIHAVMLISNRYIYYPPALFHIYEPRDLKSVSSSFFFFFSDKEKQQQRRISCDRRLERDRAPGHASGLFFSFLVLTLLKDSQPETKKKKKRREKNEEDQYNDVLAILMAYKDEKGNPLDDEDIVYSCWDMFIAGHETTARLFLFLFFFPDPDPDRVVDS